MMTKKTCRNI